MTRVRRYKNAAGYVRLRWRENGRIREVYEHRHVMNAQPGEHVHHINGIRDDNRPENLEIISPSEHTRHHHSTLPVDRILSLYATGRSMPEVAAEVDADPSAVYRLLVRHGVPVRPGSMYNRLDINTDVVRSLHDFGVRSRRIAAELGVSPWTVDQRIRELGLTPHREGRRVRAEAAIRALWER